MLAFVLPSFIACQSTARPGLSSIERHNNHMRDMEQRTRRVYEFVMLSIAEWARMPEIFDHSESEEKEMDRPSGAVEVCRVSVRLF